MLWQVRALLPDRPGAMASLAGRCGEGGANILALDVHPTAEGEVVDRLVLHAPDHWSAGDVEALCMDAGVLDCTVSSCSARALEDQPVRHLRAARTLLEQPDRLQHVLCDLLEARPAPAGAAATLLLDDEAGPRVALDRAHAFTATEVARVAELRILAQLALSEGSWRAPAPSPQGLGMLRRGTPEDVTALVEMHDRCSPESLSRRYLSPLRRLAPRMAARMLEPEGFSLVFTGSEPDTVVGFAMVAGTSGGRAEAAILVEDGWQRQRVGTRLLRALADEAAQAGVTELVLLTRRDNGPVLATIRRAGLLAHVSASADGVREVRVPVRPARTDRGPGRASRGRITTPLVDLLHRRQELREVYAPADFIDRAVRDGV